MQIKYEAMSLWLVCWAVQQRLLAVTLGSDTDEVSS